MFNLIAENPQPIMHGRKQPQLDFNIWCWGTVLDMIRFMVIAEDEPFASSIDWTPWYFNDGIHVDPETAAKISELCLDYIEKHPFPHDLPPTRENRELGDRNSEMLKTIMKLHPTAKHVASTYKCDKQKEYDVGLTMLFMKYSGGFRIK